MAVRYPQSKIKVGVSSCLLGETVRWNGEHKLDSTLKDTLSRLFEWVPTCPEVEIGMGVPRETVRLAGNLKSPRMVGNHTGKDWTPRMHRYSKKRSTELAKMRVCGYIFKARSPSCGIARIPVTTKNGKTPAKGRGLFADAFMRQCPWAPVEDESRMQDARIRENFITRVFAYHRLTQLLNGRFSFKALIEFHSAHRCLLMAHSRKHCNMLGKLIADAKKYSPAKLKRRYAETFMQSLAFKTTAKKNFDVLVHMLGMLRKQLTEAERKEVIKAIENYRRGSTPLMKPVNLIKRHVRKYKVDTLADQIYLYSHPRKGF